jgi:hypothetical protein
VQHRDIVVIGASAGGFEVLRQILRDLPGQLPASVFVVVHMSADGPGLLATVLARHTALPVEEAADGTRCAQGASTSPSRIITSCSSTGASACAAALSRTGAARPWTRSSAPRRWPTAHA